VIHQYEELRPLVFHLVFPPFQKSFPFYID
jgi:hypothetical protein